MTVKIALFGKGGTGKTTIAANLSAALAEDGQRVLLVGCGPTADSSLLLLGDASPVTLFDYLQSAHKPAANELIASGYRGIGCIETGDFHRTEHCAARSVAQAFRLLDDLELITGFHPDYVIYDLPGDIGCISTSMLDNARIDTALIVTSADYQSMYAANRYIGAIAREHAPGKIALIANGSAGSFEDSLVVDFAQQVGLQVAAAIPRSL